MGSQSAEQKKGILYAAGAYTMWGILPIYWKWVEEVPADEILAHRIVWAFVFMLLVLGVTKRFRQFIGEFVNLFKRPKLLMSLTIASVLISGNWFVYIWAVNHNHVIEASLGYYINPLISILLGTVVLKEKVKLLAICCSWFSWSGGYHFNSAFRIYSVGFSFTCLFIWIIRINEKNC